MYGCKSWIIKRTEHWRIDAFELWCWRTLGSPLDSNEIKPVNPKGNQPWKFIRRTDAEAETPILWPPDAKSQAIGKDPDAGKHWGQEEKRATEEMVGWHHGLNGHEFEQTLGNSERQGSLACCSSWGCRVKHNLVTEQQQEGTSILLSLLAAPIYIPTHSVGGFPFLHTLYSICYLWNFFY